MTSKTNKNHWNLKAAALISLTIQNVTVVLLSSYVRSRPGPMFAATTAVVMSEIVKFGLSIYLVYQEENFNYQDFVINIKTNILTDWKDNMLIMIPGILYMIQNNLLYIAYSNLTPGIFQVSYQLKLLTTAMFSRIMLHRLLSNAQWFALMLLFSGVAMTNVDFLGLNDDTVVKQDEVAKSFPLGFAAVLCGCLISGAAGVYFEKLLKGSHKSVAVRNIQLGFIGFVSGMVSVFIKEYDIVMNHGFFYGYDFMVFIVILVQSAGGLIVAAVVKYADSILKGYATSISIVLTFFLSIVFLGTSIKYNIACGTVLVIASTIIYSKYPYIEPTLSK